MIKNKKYDEAWNGNRLLVMELDRKGASSIPAVSYYGRLFPAVVPLSKILELVKESGVSIDEVCIGCIGIPLGDMCQEFYAKLYRVASDEEVTKEEARLSRVVELKAELEALGEDLQGELKVLEGP